ncbi:MAG: hypothetical protein HC880_16130 [Bacteroidia bacterium]|nr:hypothetical protein [Bacteroidia bacterium]
MHQALCWLGYIDLDSMARKMTESGGTGGLTQDYGFRLYNPALGRFLSVDPLAPDYPWYSPYQFAGDSPIFFVDIDGAEPKPSDHNYGHYIIFGNEGAVKAINETHKLNTNWIVFRMKTLENATSEISKLNASGIKAKIVYLQHHGSTAQAQLIGSDISLDNGLGSSSNVVTGEFIDYYITNYRALSKEGKEESIKQLGRRLMGIGDKEPRVQDARELMQAVQNIEQIGNGIEDGGTLISAGCHCGELIDEYGNNYEDFNGDYAKALSRLFNNRINILTNMDFTRGSSFTRDAEGNRQNFKFLDITRTSDNFYEKGWRFIDTNGNDTMGVRNPFNLILNSYDTPMSTPAQTLKEDKK